MQVVGILLYTRVIVYVILSETKDLSGSKRGNAIPEIFRLALKITKRGFKIKMARAESTNDRSRNVIPDFVMVLMVLMILIVLMVLTVLKKDNEPIRH